MKHIEAFWNWFEANHQAYNNFNELYEENVEEATNILTHINSEIQKFSKGLSVEVYGSPEKRELVVTAKGDKNHFADAFELVDNAPIIDGWSIVATNPPMEVLDFDFEMPGEVRIAWDNITFMPLEANEYPHDVAIRLYHKDYVAEEGAQRNVVIVGLYSALNLLLGELHASLDFQYIDFDDMPHPKEQDYPFSQLKEYIEHKKSQRPNAGQKFPKENIGLMEGRIEELPTLLVLNQALKFYEFTQSYPYLLQITLTLKNIGENGLPIGNTDELYLIEDVVYQGIPKNEKGHFLATETYNGKRDLFYYADSKETIDETLKSLPTEYTSCEVHYSVDYDPFWIRAERYREM